ncbi:MAG TPA: D-alanyl-D-alanine carboxypeptidase/D-alanyl-D-alanine-endopeptidase [Pyrinomonadaceae bacterium]|nr:D-alanyl-D-alanine carboxypeptidase/D-alanyl-D-alanine-endopeptidase [Pyrinomonadaceae bacterium]
MLKHVRLSTCVLILLAGPFAQFAIPFSSAQQQPQRERRVETSPTPTPAATPFASPAPFVSPTPAIGSTTAHTTRSLGELQTRIRGVLQRPSLAQAFVGVKVTSAETGKILFEENSNKLLRPASGMKLYTVATALDRLSPDYRFVTSVYARTKPDAAGVIRGDLTLYGRGDPSLSFRFNNNDYFKALNDLAARIVAAGVKRVEGDLVGDETYFVGPPYGGGWEWEDLQWWYGAEVSALTVNDNYLELTVASGTQPGAPAVVTIRPAAPLLAINNRVITSVKGTRRDLNVYRPLNSDTIELSGTIPAGDTYTGRIAMSRPALLMAYLLRSALAQQGVTITGKTRVVPAPPAATTPVAEPAATGVVEVANFQSHPLSLISAHTLKPSQNLYTEMLLRALGRVAGPLTASAATTRTSEAAGLEVVKAFLRDAGVNPSSVVLADGSGLSRSDMITADATVQLLAYMRRHRYAVAFREALPVGGVDGTLRNRFKGTVAENNLRAKTGTLSTASSLSGYVTTAAGEELIFSIIVNNYPDGTSPVAECIDPIALLLASFAVKS